MSDWKKVKLNKVLKQYRIEHWVQDGKMYKQVTISKYDGVVYRGEKKGNEIGRKRQFIIDLDKYPNTLLFVRQGLEDGGIGLAPKEVNQCIATENMPMFSVEGIETEYLNIFLKSEVFKAQVRALEQTGSAQKSIHEKQLMELEIPLPSVTEQKELIKKFKTTEEKYSDILSELTSQQTLITQLRQSILQEAVQGKLVKQNKNDEPANELLKRIKAEKEKLIKQGKLKKDLSAKASAKAGKPLPPISENEIPYQLSEGWVWCRLIDITSVITCGMASTPIYRESGRMFLSAKNVKPYRFIPENYKYVDEETYRKCVTNSKPEKGDILLTRVGAGIGEAAIIDREIDFAFYVSLTLIKPMEILSEYLLHWLNSSEGTNKAIKYTSGKGGSQGNLNVNEVRKFVFPLPPLPEQKRIVEKVNQLMQHCNELEQQVQQSITHAQHLMQAVLREVFEKKKEMEQI